MPAYAASKGGVAQLTKALANEWAPKGVTVNAIAPGYIATNNTKALRENETRNRQILERIPAGPLGRPQGHRGRGCFPVGCGQSLHQRPRAFGGWRLDGPVN